MLSVVIAAPPMNLIGPELVRDLVSMIGELESGEETRVMVLESADPDYFIPHVDLTKVAEYAAEAAKAGGPDDARSWSPPLTSPARSSISTEVRSQRTNDMSDRDHYPSPARLWRKIYWRIIPVVSLAWLCSSIDRGSLGYVAVPLSKDLGLSATGLGFAAGIVFIGHIVVPVPGNLVQYRVGARTWITAILIAWSLVTGAIVRCTSDVPPRASCYRVVCATFHA